MHDFAKDLLLAAAIGAEVFAIAALWPLSEWALKKPRRLAFAAAMAVVLACMALETHGLAFDAIVPGTLRWKIAHSLEWMVLPLFIAVPDAVCVASAQSLARAGVSARRARATSRFIAAVAVVVAPVATLVAGSGLAGACL